MHLFIVDKGNINAIFVTQSNLANVILTHRLDERREVRSKSFYFQEFVKGGTL